MTTAVLAAALVVLLVVSGVPLGRLACRRDPGPLRRHPADTRGACPPHCITCTALNEGDR
ncbi:hypothetical protein [Streptomyces sp. SudanB25_2051]|uniref:hypothetical protein n=1 Tax=Streptomyces sp. SudanB25_2051 TaxID=3035275 RepID=UPI003F557E72